MTKQTFTVHTNWYEVISVLSQKEQLAIYKRLFLFYYGRHDEIPLNTKGLQTVWSVIEKVIKPHKDSSVKTWRNDYSIYVENVTTAFKLLLNDKEFIQSQEKFFPYVDIRLTIEKAYKTYWCTEDGWKRRRRSKAKQLDWKATFTFSLNQKFNQVMKKNSSNNLSEPDAPLCEWMIPSLGKKRKSTYVQFELDQKRYGIENVKWIGYVK